MKTSQKGINLIKYFESLHDGDLTEIGLQPKMCPAGIWTEGYGHAIRDLKGQFFKGKDNKLKAYANSIVKNENSGSLYYFKIFGDLLLHYGNNYVDFYRFRCFRKNRFLFKNRPGSI